MNAGVHTERRAGSYGKRECAITADESDCVAEDSITRARGLRQERKKEEIRSWAERRKDKGAARKKCQQREQSDGDKAVDAYIDRLHDARDSGILVWPTNGS